jgi:cytochrome c556
MILKNIRIAFPLAAVAIASLAIAGEDPRHKVMNSFHTFEKASKKLGGLFPPGSETGEDTEAAPAIWEDREGFDAAIAEWQEAVAAAIAAAPASLEEAKPVAGPIFNACKGCHDNYRIEKED